MDNKRWNTFLSLQKNDENAPPPDKNIAISIDVTEKILTKLGVFDYFSLPEYENIIVIGASNGRDVVSLLNHGYQAIGTTLHHSDKKFAQDNYSINLIVEDMHDMKSIQTGYYDGVYSYHVLEHSLSPIIALFETRRVLRMSGKLLCIISFPGTNDDTGLQHYSILRPEHWRHILNLIGFDDIQIDIIREKTNNGNDIIIKATKGDRDCPGRYLEQEVNRSTQYKQDTDNLVLNNDSDIDGPVLDNNGDIELFVENTYLDILKRDADLEGKNRYIKAIKEGIISKEQLSSIFRKSKEYKSRKLKS